MTERAGTAPESVDHPRPGSVHVPSHMKGYEAFGVTRTAPVVRCLGLVTFGPKGKGPATTEERPGTEEWHPDEVKDGVASVQLSVSGDDPDDAYLYVCGPDREAVEARWRLIDLGWEDIASRLWPTPRAAMSTSEEGRSGSREDRS